MSKHRNRKPEVYKEELFLRSYLELNASTQRSNNITLKAK